MHEGESEEYLLRLRPRDLDALAGAMRERATEEVTPRLEVSVEVAGNRELDALRRLLARSRRRLPPRRRRHSRHSSYTVSRFASWL